MSEATAETRSVIVEREIPFPADRIWRALTQPHLMAEWLMKNDFAPQVGHRFSLNAAWGNIDCEVLQIEPPRSLAYRWAAQELNSVVTWTLTPTAAGTHLRMEQSGFPKSFKAALGGATAGWPRFFDALERTLQRLDDEGDQ